MCWTKAEEQAAPASAVHMEMAESASRSRTQCQAAPPMLHVYSSPMMHTSRQLWLWHDSRTSIVTVPEPEIGGSIPTLHMVSRPLALRYQVTSGTTESAWSD